MTLATLMLFLAPAFAGWSPARADRAAYSDALVALGNGRVDAAAAGFSALLDRDPACGMCQQGLGVAQLRAGQVDRARGTLEAAAQRWPDQPEVWASLSAAAFVAQDFTRATEAARKGVSVDPGSLDAQAALQQVLLRTGDLDAARAALSGASAALPGPVVACFAVQVAQEAGQTPSADDLARCRRAGTAELVAGALSRSAEESAQVGALASRLGMDPVVLVAQALELVDAGAPQDAQALLDTVLEGWPHRVDARALRAGLRRESGDAAGAVADLEALVQATPWIDVHRSGATSGILRKSDADRLRGTVAEAAALLVDLHREAGRLDVAAARLEASGPLGPHPALVGAGFQLAAARGAAPWDAVAAALDAHPGHPRVLAGAAAVALVDPGGLPDAVRGALSGSADWRDRYNLALALRRAGDATGCVTTAATAAPLSDDAATVATLRYACAVESADVDQADAALPHLDAAAPALRYNHAVLHFNAGAHARALEALGPAPDAVLADPGASAAVVEGVLSLAIRSRQQTDDLDGALKLATSGRARPQDRLWLAEQLSDAGQPVKADAALPADCAALGEPLAGRCAVLRASVGGR